MTAPDYKQMLWRYLRGKGFGSDTISRYMALGDIDNRIKDAKTQQANNNYYRSLMAGDPVSASYWQTQLASLSQPMAATNMAQFPTVKDMWINTNRREDAKTAIQAKQNAQAQQQQFQLYRDEQQLRNQIKLAAAKENMSLESYMNKLNWQQQQLAQIYGPEEAKRLILNHLAGISNNPSKGSKSGGEGSDNDIWADEGELSPTELNKVYQSAEKWAENNPDADPSENPHLATIRRSERATDDRLNNRRLTEVRNSDDAYHNATTLLEMADKGDFDKNGMKPTKAVIYGAIKQYCGPYADQIIKEWQDKVNANDLPMLAQFPDKQEQ